MGLQLEQPPIMWELSVLKKLFFLLNCIFLPVIYKCPMIEILMKLQEKLTFKLHSDLKMKVFLLTSLLIISLTFQEVLLVNIDHSRVGFPSRNPVVFEEIIRSSVAQPSFLYLYALFISNILSIEHRYSNIITSSFLYLHL